MKKCLIVLFFFIAALSYTQEKQSKNGLLIEYAKTIEDFEMFKKQTAIDIKNIEDKYQHSIELSNRSISITGIMLSVATIIMTMFSIILAIIVGVIYDKTSKMVNQSRRLSDEIIAINNDIKCNMSLIYQKLQDEEITWKINRLNRVPQDINNNVEYFLAINLDCKYFDLIKRAMINYYDRAFVKDTSYEHNYALVLMQHFPDLCFFDNVCYEKISPYLDRIANSFFENDLVCTMTKIISAYSSKDISYDSKFNDLLSSIEKSKLSTYQDFGTNISSVIGKSQYKVFHDYVKTLDGLTNLKAII